MGKRNGESLKKLGIILCLITVIFLAAANSSDSAETSLVMGSDPGDYIGYGLFYSYFPADGAFTAQRNYDNGVSISFHTPDYSHWWYLDFAAPNNKSLTLGTYTGATRFPFQDPSVSGLDVSGDGRGCNTLTGSFEVKQISYGTDNDIIAFWATFEQHCEGGEPALKGEVRFNAAALMINGGAKATKNARVLLMMHADDANGVSGMCISNTRNCASWVRFATSTNWTLMPGDGKKTVYVWFKNKKGEIIAAPYSASIILDTTAPTNGRVTAAPGHSQVTLNWSGFSDAASGVASYKVVNGRSSTPYSCSYGTTIYTGSNTSFIQTGLTNGITYYYRVCAIDNAGNISSGATASAKPQ